jgi:hypothetical protein
LEEHEIDCEAGEDEEWSGTTHVDDLQPGMSAEFPGIVLDITRTEEWNASCLAHEASVADRRPPPEIHGLETHLDFGHSSLRRQL